MARFYFYLPLLNKILLQIDVCGNLQSQCLYRHIINQYFSSNTHTAFQYLQNLHISFEFEYSFNTSILHKEIPYDFWENSTWSLSSQCSINLTA